MATAQKEIFLSPSQFRSVNRLNRKSFKTVQVKENESIEIILPKIGLGKHVLMTIYGTLTCSSNDGVNPATITAGTWQSYPDLAPFSIFKSVTCSPDTSLLLVNCSATALYYFQRLLSNIDPLSVVNDAYSDDERYIRGATNYGGKVSGSNVIQFDQGPRGGASLLAPNGNATISVPVITPYVISFNCSLTIPLSYGNGDTGLITLGTGANEWKIVLQVGRILEGLTTTTGTNELFQGMTGTNMKWAYDIKADFTLVHYDANRTTPDGIPINYDPQTFVFSQLTSKKFDMTVGDNYLPVPNVDRAGLIAVQCSHKPSGVGTALGRNDIGNVSLEKRSALSLDSLTFRAMSQQWFLEHRGGTLPNGIVAFDNGIANGNPFDRDLVKLLPANSSNDLVVGIEVLPGTWTSLRGDMMINAVRDQNNQR